jgi:hypothetical protein
MPHLCLEAWKAILKSDLIVLSSGTMWSSLIPTYASQGFKAAINASRAHVLMIMNRVPDKDSPGQSASDIIDILVPRYFDPNRLHVLADVNAHPKMRSLDETALRKVASFSSVELSTPNDAADKHNPAKLAFAVGSTFFRDYLDSDFYLFDYDDTLVGRGQTHGSASRFNVGALPRLNSLIDVGICTGNTIRAIRLDQAPAELNDSAHSVGKPIPVFADGGINEYSYATRVDSRVQREDGVSAKCIWPSAQLPRHGPYGANGIISALLRVGVSPDTIENRGDALIAVKPVAVDDRESLICLLQHVVEGSGLEVREVGTTTVEICRPTLSKSCALRYFYESCGRFLKVTYIGDEFNSGNDRDIAELSSTQAELKCLHVESPTKTAFFISVLIEHLTRDVQH